MAIRVCVKPSYLDSVESVFVDIKNQDLLDIKAKCQPLINKLGLNFGEVNLSVGYGRCSGIEPSFDIYTKIFVDKNSQK